MNVIAQVEPRPAGGLDGIIDLYERGLYLQAYRASQELGPLHTWKGADAAVLAGRLAGNLGGMRLAQRMFLRAWRSDPNHADACWFRGRALLDYRGPWAAWKYLKSRGEMKEAPAKQRANWYTLHGTVLGALRDFDAAEAWLARAEEIPGEHPWILVERSTLLLVEDRLPEALEVSRQALALRAWYRPAIQSTAFLLVQLSRDHEALELLTEGANRLESESLVLQLAVLQRELGHYADARRSFERAVELAPLADKVMTAYLNSNRSDTAYLCGDRAAAIELIKDVPGPYTPKLIERMTNPPADCRRVVLPVGFVRQHFSTCVPATMTALCRYWSMPGDHLEVAAAICYDGTPHHSERRWAEEHGCIAREFSVTWKSTLALIDRGVPFSLTTVESTSAHLQAVIGYDSLRGTLLIRDPMERHQRELDAETILTRYASSGPRGMAMVPRDKAEKLAGLDLPDAELFDHMHNVQRALQDHQREHAALAFRAMEAAAPEHRLTILARKSLAAYDADAAESLACTEQLLKLYPDDVPLQLMKAANLRDLAHRDDRLTLLKKLCDAPAVDPLSLQQYAQELIPDAREHPKAVRLLRRSLRFNSQSGITYASLADIASVQRHTDEALELRRFAVCVQDKDERLAQDYLIAARTVNRAEEALSFLQKRFERYGKQSALPGRTLAWAYLQVNRGAEAEAVLHQAMAQRPLDGDLLLFAAEVFAGNGDHARAEALLKNARGLAAKSRWLRSAALLASLAGDGAAALGHWQEILRDEPLALDAHQSAVHLLAERQSRAAALQHLQEACDRFPHHYALHKLWIEWLYTEANEALEPVIRRLIAIHPNDAWARRELAISLGELRRLDEAFAELELAFRLEPLWTPNFNVQGRLLTLAGRLPEAKQAYREAIRLSVDADYAVRQLLGLCDTQAERREALEFVQQELIRQVILGEGLLTFRSLAQGTFSTEELETLLRQALDARPDLWHAWSAVIQQLFDMGRLDEADKLAREAVRRFPYLPVLWLELAKVSAAKNDAAAEMKALTKALQINPTFAPVVLQLADACVRGGQLPEAVQLLERTVQRSPLQAHLHITLAKYLWRQSEKEKAISSVQEALRIDPGWDEGWDLLSNWSTHVNRANAVVDLARELTERRPGEARSWLVLSRVLAATSSFEPCLEALDRSLVLNPGLLDAYDRKAEILARLGRWREALAACSPPGYPTPPLFLRGRAAWIQAEQGNFEAAIEALERVIADDPNYYWGWSNLAQWNFNLGRWQQSIDASDKLIAMAPRHAVSYGFRAQALLQLQKTQAAIDDCRKALELDPGYLFAGTTLFGLLLDAHDWTQAEDVLKSMRPYIRDDEWMCYQVRLALAQNSTSKALDWFEKLCVLGEAEVWWLDQAKNALVAANRLQRTQTSLRKLALMHNAHPHVGEMWVKFAIEHADWSHTGDLDACREHPAGRRALIAHAEALGLGRQIDALRRFIDEYAGELRSDTFGWGKVGYALSVAFLDVETVDWLADWKQRPDCEAWMLLNLALSLRQLNRDREAREVSMHAVTLKSDGTGPLHESWLAIDDALSGDAAVAADRLGQIAINRMQAYYQFLHVLASSVVDIRQAAADDRKRTFKQVRRRLADFARQNAPLTPDPALRKVYRLCIQHIAQETGTFTAKVWAWWRGWNPLFPPNA